MLSGLIAVYDPYFRPFDDGRKAQAGCSQTQLFPESEVVKVNACETFHEGGTEGALARAGDPGEDEKDRCAKGREIAGGCDAFIDLTKHAQLAVALSCSRLIEMIQNIHSR